MVKSKFFYNVAIVAAKSVFVCSIATVFGLLLASCAGSNAIKSAPSIDAVTGLNNKLIWLKANAVTGSEYVIELSADDAISSGLFSKGTLYYKDKSNITITIRGVGENRTIFQKSPGDQMFDVGSGVTLVLDNNITLRGSREADSTLGSHNKLVGVSSGGTLVMNEGAAIVGNVNNMGSGGAVAVSGGGAFIMNGGVISGNMSILGKAAINNAIQGAIIAKAGTAALLGAASDNLPKHTMLSKGLGNASDNVAKSKLNPSYPACLGGGVYVSGGSSFFGKNTPAGTFVKNGGIITGYDNAIENGNLAHDCDVDLQMDDAGNVAGFKTQYRLSANGGHAIYFGGNEPKSVDKTVGPNECFEFRDGVYREIQCNKPKPPEPPEPEAVIAKPEHVGEAAPLPDVPVSEEASVLELSALLAGTGTVQEAAQTVEPAQPIQAPPPQTQPTAPVQPTHDAVPQPIQPVQPKLDSKPNIAAYVFGAKDPALNKAMSTRLIIALTKSGRYQASEEYMEFFDQAVAEQKGGSTQLDVNLMKGLGERFGVDYVCVAEIVTVFGEYRTFAHLLRVKTAKSTAKGNSELPLKTLAELTSASEQIVESMFKKEAPPSVAAIAAPTTTVPAQSYEPPAPCFPSKEEQPVTAAVESLFKQRAKAGFTLGYGFSGDANIIQFGGVYIHPIAEKIISLTAEADFRFGELNISFDKYNETISYYGMNIPVLCRFETSAVFAETGLFADVLLGKKEGWVSDNVWMTNFGVALGGGVAFSKGYTQYFYRFNYGNAYYSHLFGIKQLF